MKTLCATLALSTLALANIATADSTGFSIERVTAYTRDGGAWQPGQAVLLAFDVRGPAGSFPESGLAVVMQVQGERTKCLDVPLRRIDANDGLARYAGAFHPFYAARFDGKVMFGDSAPQDFAFQVDETLAPATLPRDVPAADPRAAAPPSPAESLSASLPAAFLVALLLLIAPLALLRRPFAATGG